MTINSVGVSRHGRSPRGIEAAALSSRGGRFGRLFATLPAARHDEKVLTALGLRMTAPFDPLSPDVPNAEENPAMPAGYTYLAQFIDHDLTFDPASLAQRLTDHDALTDYRTPRFDLDCLYGQGPADQPYLYEDDGVRMVVGTPLRGNPLDLAACDLPRRAARPGLTARALIGDPRNDSNAVLAQLHSLFLRFHNLMADHLERRVLRRTPSFEEVRRQVLFHYQWIVLHDVLPTIVGGEIVEAVAPHIDLENPGADADPHRTAPELRFYRPWPSAWMPLEFSVAAYRFAHATARPCYRLNDQVITPIDRGRSDVGDGLSLPAGWAIDWRRFFHLPGEPPAVGRAGPMMAYKPDTSLGTPLGLVADVEGGFPPVACWDLLRGVRLRLPSGQDVARALGERPLTEERIRIGRSTVADLDAQCELAAVDDGFRGNAPLWVYILAETMQPFLTSLSDDTGSILGPVGGRIVAETFIGLLLCDSTSYLGQAPGFRPDPELAPTGRFGIAELIDAVLRADAA